MKTRHKLLLAACAAVVISCVFPHQETSAIGLDIVEGQTYQGNVNQAVFSGYGAGYETYAGVHFNRRGDLKVLNNKFIENESSGTTIMGFVPGGGGAIYSNYGTVDINNSLFERNKSTGTATLDGGGALFLERTTSAIINETVFDGNSAGNDGGAIYAYSAQNLQIKNSEFNNNTANSHGGAINFDSVTKNSDTYNVDNTKFNNNSAEYGGAIAVQGSSSSPGRGISINNSKFNTNHSETRGGAIYASNDFEVDNSKFIGNTSGEGGAIYIINDGPNVISNTLFQNNQAETRGGAIQVTEGTVQINNSRFEGNESGTRGGAMSISVTQNNTSDAYPLKSVYIFNTDFVNNKSKQNSGGAIYVNVSQDKSIKGNKIVQITSNDGKTHEFTGNMHGTGEEQFNPESNAIYIDEGTVTLKTSGDGSKLLFNDGIAGSHSNLSADFAKSKAMVNVNGDVIFNNQVKNTGVTLQGGELTLNSAGNTYLPVDKDKMAPVPIMKNVDLVLESGTLNLQNDKLDTLELRHFNATNVDNGVRIALDADLSKGQSDLFNVAGDIKGNLDFDAEHFDINIIKGGTKSFQLFNRWSDLFTFNNNSLIQYNESEKYTFTIGEDGFINVKRDSSGGLSDAILAEGKREFRLNPAKDLTLSESLGAMGGEYLKVNLVEQDLNANKNSGIIVSDGQKLELVNLGNADGSKSAHDFVSETSGAVVDNSGELIIRNSYFKDNSTKADGGVVNNNKKASVNIVDSSFVNNKADGNGGAINNIGGNVKITASDKDVLFSGNTANGKANDIYMANNDDNMAVVTFDGSKTTTLNGGIAGNGTIVKNGSGTLALGGDNRGFNGDVVYNGGETRLLENAQYLSAVNTTFDNNGMLNLIDNKTDDHINFNNLNLKGNGRIGIDVDMKNGLNDTIAANTVTGDGKLIIDKVNILPDIHSTAKSLRFNIIQTDKDGKSPLFGKIGVNPNGGEAMGPIFKYGIGYDEATGQMLLVGKSGKNHTAYNPAVMAGSIGALAGGYLTQLNSYDMAFNNMDMFMLMSKEDRMVLKYGNKFAVSEGQIQAPVRTQYDQRGTWFKPYSSFEKVGLRNGPRVSNVGYGAFFGGDSELKELGHGFDGIFSVYAGYNGSHQSYFGNSIYQNGGHLGVSGMAYKGNFFTGLTANVGASSGEAHTMYGHENFTMLMAGIAAKAGYNWELADGKFIIQPNYLMSYSFINTFDYHNAAGISIDANPLNAIQLSPGIRFIGNFKNGWQPYAGLNIVWNILDDTKFKANDVSLPNLSVKPYFQYGIGLQKSIGERFTGFLQAMFRAGGRNGVGLQFGFRATL